MIFAKVGSIIHPTIQNIIIIVGLVTASALATSSLSDRTMSNIGLIPSLIYLLIKLSIADVSTDPIKDASTMSTISGISSKMISVDVWG